MLCFNSFFHIKKNVISFSYFITVKIQSEQVPQSISTFKLHIITEQSLMSVYEDDYLTSDCSEVHSTAPDSFKHSEETEIILSSTAEI